MVGKKLKAFGSSRGWYLGEKSVFGTEDGFLVNVLQSDRMETPSYKAIRVDTASVPEDGREKLRARLEAQKKTIGFSSVGVFEHSTVVTFTESLRSTPPEKLDAALDLVLSSARDLGIHPHFSTFAGSDRQPYVHEGHGLLLTASERQELDRKLTYAASKQREQERGYANGVLGAVIFGSLGVVAWVLVAYYLNIISTMLAFGIAFLTVLGFEKFDGTMGALTKPLLVLVNILLVFAASFATDYIDLYGYGMSIPEAWNFLLFDPQVRGTFLANLGLSALMGSVGIWVIIANLKTAADPIRPATAL